MSFTNLVVTQNQGNLLFSWSGNATESDVIFDVNPFSAIATTTMGANSATFPISQYGVSKTYTLRGDRFFITPIQFTNLAVTQTQDTLRFSWSGDASVSDQILDGINPIATTSMTSNNTTFRTTEFGVTKKSYTLRGYPFPQITIYDPLQFKLNFSINSEFFTIPSTQAFPDSVSTIQIRVKSVITDPAYPPNGVNLTAGFTLNLTYPFTEQKLNLGQVTSGIFEVIFYANSNQIFITDIQFFSNPEFWTVGKFTTKSPALSNPYNYTIQLYDPVKNIGTFKSTLGQSRFNFTYAVISTLDEFVTRNTEIRNLNFPAKTSFLILDKPEILNPATTSLQTNSAGLPFKPLVRYRDTLKKLKLYYNAGLLTLQSYIIDSISEIVANKNDILQIALTSKFIRLYVFDTAKNILNGYASFMPRSYDIANVIIFQVQDTVDEILANVSAFEANPSFSFLHIADTRAKILSKLTDIAAVADKISNISTIDGDFTTSERATFSASLSEYFLTDYTPLIANMTVVQSGNSLVFSWTGALTNPVIKQLDITTNTYTVKTTTGTGSPLTYTLTPDDMNKSIIYALFGTNFSNIFSPITPGITPEVIPLSNICFVKDTMVRCDQGWVAIQHLEKQHTFGGHELVAVTKTVSLDQHLIEFEANCFCESVPLRKITMSENHCLCVAGVLKKAKDFEQGKRVPYTGETLYNILLDVHGIVNVEGVACETLHPSNSVAHLFREKASDAVIEKWNASALLNKVF